MSKELYKNVCEECSNLITGRYSTSFSLGIRALETKYRQPIRNVYGFVRFADEIVDTFHEQDKRALLTEFRLHTFDAIERRMSANPVLHSFQLTVHEYGISADLINAFLNSMEMDLDRTSYDESGYKQYIYGSAEVIGLMCLRIFCEGDEARYDSLKDGALALGSAFQKVNFLRDMRSDLEERGRIYFPGVDLKNGFNEPVKVEIEDDIRADFRKARKSIQLLPAGCRFGVYVAYVYYLKLLQKIENMPAGDLLHKRVRIPDMIKAYLFITSYIRNKAGLL